MINYRTMVIKEINEEFLFDYVKDYLFEEFADDNGTLVKDLPKDVQRIIFAKVGAMMIDYAGSKDF